jgi:hypothetical protein
VFTSYNKLNDGAVNESSKLPLTQGFLNHTHSVTDDMGSKPDQRHARWRDKQIYIRKNKVYIQDFDRQEYQYVGTLEGCGLLGCCEVYGCVCSEEGFGLLLAKVCELIASLTPCKQNIL